MITPHLLSSKSWGFTISMPSGPSIVALQSSLKITVRNQFSYTSSPNLHISPCDVYFKVYSLVALSYIYIFYLYILNSLHFLSLSLFICNTSFSKYSCTGETDFLAFKLFSNLIFVTFKVKFFLFIFFQSMLEINIVASSWR